MADKEFKTYAEMIEILRSRGMVIEHGDQAAYVESVLRTENYYNVINGYKELFIERNCGQEPERYKDGTTFEEVYALYRFDRDVRHIYLRGLLKAENSFKTVISHEFSRVYGHDNYLKMDNFDLEPPEQKIAEVIKLIGDIQQEIARQMGKRHQVVTHYMSQHGYMPLWVLVNVLTFGKITTFYKNMKPADRLDVARQFGVASDELHKYMENLGLARNKCAHDERFFDMKFKKALHTKSIRNFAALELPRRTDGSYVNGTNDIYAIAIIFARILDQAEVEAFISAMEAAFSVLAGHLQTISITDVMHKMGYHENWKNLRCLK